MRDRISTKILGNGAARYGVYDEDGNLLRYEYIKLEDEPDEEGSLWNKANVLPDHITALLGLKMGNPQVKDALNVLANIGNVHVWSRSWMASEEIPEVPPGYTLGEVQENVVLASRKTSISIKGTFYYYFGDSVTVENDGTVNNPPDDAYTFLGRDVSASTVKSGPLFVKGATNYIGAGSGYPVADLTSDATKVFYIPAGGALIVTVEPDPDNSAAKICRVVATRYQLVTGFPYVPAVPAGIHTNYLTSTQQDAYTEGVVDGVTTTYLGQLGDKAQIEVGSYVGTGTQGSSNKNTLTLGFEPKLLIITPATRKSSNNSVTWLGIYTGGRGDIYGINHRTNYSDAIGICYMTATVSDVGISWYSDSADNQMNTSGATFHYAAIG